MKRLVLILFCLIIIIISCSKEYKKEYYEDGKLKQITFYENNNRDSIISYNEFGKREFVKKIYKKDSIHLWEYNKNGLVKDGILYNKKAYGKWNFYKKNYVNIVREYVILNDKSYFNQEWHFEKNGDTIKDKGNYFKISSNNTFKVNKNETIRFFFEKPISNFYKNEMTLVFDAEFHNKKTKEIQKDNGEILGVNNEVLYEVLFEDEGEFLMKGYILEKYKFVNDSTSERISRTRKLYFDKKITVVDSGNGVN